MKMHSLYRSFIFFTIYLSLGSSLNAQNQSEKADELTLEGRVIVHNSKYRTGKTSYVSEAFINAKHALPTDSDSEGRFTLVFFEKPQNGVTDLLISKDGMELVNRLGRNNAVLTDLQSPVKVYMTNSNELYLDWANLLTVFLDKVNLISIIEDAEAQSNFQAEELEGEELAKMESIIESNYQSHISLAEEFSYSLSRVNLDLASKEFIRVYESMLNNIQDDNFRIPKLSQIQKEIDKLVSFREKSASKARTSSKTIKEFNTKLYQLQDEILIYGMYSGIHGEWEEAEMFFRKATELNPSFFGNWLHLGQILQAQDKAEDLALLFDGMMSSVSDSSHILLANMLHASALNSKGNSSQAISGYTLALTIAEQQMKNDPVWYADKRASILFNLAYSHVLKEDLDMAITYMEQSAEAYKELSEAFPIYTVRWAFLLDKLGLIYNSIKEYNKASEAYLQAAKAYEKLSSENDLFEELLAESLYKLATSYFLNLELKKSEQVTRQLLESYKGLEAKYPGEFRFEIANTFKLLIAILADQNKPTDVEEVIEEFNSFFVKDENIRAEPSFYTTLGYAWIKSGEANKAISHLKLAIKLKEKEINKNESISSESTIEDWRFLGIAYTQKGEFDSAFYALEKSMDLSRTGKQSGKISDNEELGLSLVHYGHILINTGQYASAVDTLLKAEKILQATTAKPAIVLDSELTSLYRYMAKAYYSLKLPNKALAYYQKTDSLIQKLENKGHLVPIEAKVELYLNEAAVYNERGHVDEANEAAEKALTILNTTEGKALPRYRANLALGLVIKAQVLKLKGNYVESLQAHEKGIDLFRTICKNEGDSIRLAEMLYQYAKFLEENLQSEKAETVIEEQLQILENLDSDKTGKLEYQRTLALYLKTLLIVEKGQYDKVIEIGHMALKGIRKLNNEGRYDLQMATTYNALGQAYAMSNRLHEAENLMKESIFFLEKMEQKNPGFVDILLANTYFNYGLVKDMSKNYSEAILYYKKALTIFDNFGESLTHEIRSLVGRTYQRISLVYFKDGDFDKSLSYLLNAHSYLFELTQNGNERDFYDAIECTTQLGVTYYFQSNSKKAEYYFKQTVALLKKLPDSEQKRYAEHQLRTYYKKY